jgi:hypothetical protein
MGKKTCVYGKGICTYVHTDMHTHMHTYTYKYQGTAHVAGKFQHCMYLYDYMYLMYRWTTHTCFHVGCSHIATGAGSIKISKVNQPLR